MPDNLAKIEHVIVLMLENRSFDHMLGYLRLEGQRDDVDGLTGKEVNVHDGVSFKTSHLENTVFAHDPCHRSECVRDQLANQNGGFVRDFAKINPHNPGEIMGYYNSGDLPVYDHLAHEFCVCDRWFSSVRGETWPNRLYAMAGNSNGEADNPEILSTVLPGKPSPGFASLGFGSPWRCIYRVTPCRQSSIN